MVSEDVLRPWARSENAVLSFGVAVSVVGEVGVGSLAAEVVVLVVREADSVGPVLGSTTVSDGAIEVPMDGDTGSDLTCGTSGLPAVGSVLGDFTRFSEMNVTSGLPGRDASYKSELSEVGESLSPTRPHSAFCSGTVVTFWKDLAITERALKAPPSTRAKVVDVFEGPTIIVGSGRADSVASMEP
jgi:hypothetical protein